MNISRGALVGAGFGSSMIESEAFDVDAVGVEFSF